MKGRLYTIKEVASRTGLSAQLIRKWEERYGAVHPSRFPNGYRGYTKGDIDTLNWLKQQVDEGVPIGMAVRERELLIAGDSDSLSEAGPEGNSTIREWAQPEPPVAVPAADILMGTSQQMELLANCLVELDGLGARRILDEYLSKHHLEYVLLNIMEPTLVEIGERWERGEISEFQEHFASHFIRERILAIKNFFHVPEDAPILVTACAPYERHELGILIVGLMAQQQGLQVVHLGTSPSEKGILDCLRKLKPQAFAFGISSKEMFDASRTFFQSLDAAVEELSPRTRVYIGGRIVEADGPVNGLKHVYFIAGRAKEAIKKIKSYMKLK